jgi:hypothetical protein
MNKNITTILAFVMVFAVAFTSGYLFDSLTPTGAESSAEVTEQTERWRGERQQPGERDYRRMANRIAEYLELTSDQRNEFFSRMGEYRQDIQETVTEKREAEHAALVQIYYEMREEMAALLSEDQLARLDNRFHPDNVREMRARRGDGRPHGHN